MSTQHLSQVEGTDLPEAPLRQDTTNQTILCLDSEGYHHIYCEDRDRIVVLNHTGIDHQEDLSQHEDLGIGDWIAHTESERGVAKVQKYTGEMLFGDLWGCKL